MTHRNTARVVGGLFILATVAGVLALLVQQPFIGASDYLTRASLNGDRLTTGALLELIMAVAVVAISVAIYPFLRRFSETLALGYVIARTIEAVFFFIDAVALLAIMTVGRVLADPSPADSSNLQVLGDLLQAVRDWGSNAVVGVAVFPLGALILNFLLYRTRLVPRWLSGWGVLGASAYWAAGVAVLYGAEPFGPTQVLLNLPLAVQEMVLAAWLITKGFDPGAVGPRLERDPAPVGTHAS